MAGLVSSRALVRVAIPALSSGERTLDARVAHYLVGVHRLHPGERFSAFDPEKQVEAEAEILGVAAQSVTARVGLLRPARLVATRDVTWIQGIPKGEKMDGIVRDATELGVTRIVPVLTEFTVVKLDGPRREARRQRWERIAREAARQCGRGDAPLITPILGWSDALRQEEEASGIGFCLHEKAAEPIGPRLLDAVSSETPIRFAAGPEGGLSEGEVLHATTSRYTVVSLGPFVLRAETVAAATLGALRAAEGMRR